MSDNGIALLAAYRLVGHLTRDLELAAELAEDLLALGMLPDDIAVRLSSFHDDVTVALEDRAECAPKH